MHFWILVIFGVVVTQAQQFVGGSGNRKFEANIYREIQKLTSGNFLVCPISVKIILALAQVGARGNTAQQLSTGLNLPNDREKVLHTFRELIPRFQGTDKYSLSTANKIYIKKNFQIKEKYKTIAVNVFNADIETINFKRKRKAAAIMNEWVEEKTHGKIKDLISYQSLNNKTRAVLISALYFKGTWENNFEPNLTRKQPFLLNKNYYAEVDMMEKLSYYSYYESYELNAKFLEMFYEGFDISMTFVLPKDIEGLPDLEEHIEEVLIDPEYVTEEVYVRIPKFKIETTVRFKEILQELGIVDAFESNANFSGIISENIDRLKIDQVVQKTFIEVDEKGTEAADATFIGGVATGTSYGPQPPPPKEFVADHPFIYYLKSSIAGVIFIGRYVQQT